MLGHHRCCTHQAGGPEPLAKEATTMTTSVFHLPARDIPVPTSVSPQAQAMLALGPVGPATEYPPLDDAEAWRALVRSQDQAVVEMLSKVGGGASAGEDHGAQIEARKMAGVPVYVILPDGVSSDDRRVYLDIHGGAWILGGGELCKTMAARTAPSMGARVVTVDYRMPPDHPYPAAVDDCLAVYRSLLENYRPEEIIVGGGSAGGNIGSAVACRAGAQHAGDRPDRSRRHLADQPRARHGANGDGHGRDGALRRRA
jgi:monoterpene epsilon-lactone hydrolase